MVKFSGKLALLVAVLLVFSFGMVTNSRADWSGEVSYQEDVYPIIHFRCLSCHKEGAEGTNQSGLNLETYEGLMKGTKYGPIIVPGNPMISNLNVMVEGRAAIRMPHNKRRLNPCDIKILRQWVHQGARNN
ncbi:MAG: hypothetical protein HQL72_11555 [Magnetococcales bacterium]|nr:hypothetical protein [Magnetococcales bacterium]